MRPTTPRPPYIGVTGIVTDEDVGVAVEAAWLVQRRAPGHRLMAGILVGTMPPTSPFACRYPPLMSVCTLATGLRSAGALPFAHYRTSDRASLALQLHGLFVLAPDLAGVQLNVVAPSQREISAFRDLHPGVEIVLQANRGTLRRHGATQDPGPGSVDHAVDFYAGRVDHILLDLSGGRGRPLDTDWHGQVLSHGMERWLGLAIRPGVAGGLGPDSAVALDALALAIGPQRFAGLSFDAEGALRVPVETGAPGVRPGDRLDRNRVLNYVTAVLDALERAATGQPAEALTLA
jgi:hypothetical protein